MIRAVIIDDIESIRAKNIDLIKAYCPQVNIVGEACNVAGGVQLVQDLNPDLVFLDVEMPDGSGFDLLKQLKPFSFKVIFVSGYDDYAIRAFRFSAMDYLLKPIEPTELIEAVHKVETVLNEKMMEVKLNTLFANLEQPHNLHKLVLKTADKIYSVNIEDILYCESDKNYTTFHFVDAKKLLVSTTLKEYETILKPYSFFRTHHSYLINLRHFDHFVKADGGNTIVMKNKAEIPLSVRKKESFLAELERL